MASMDGGARNVLFEVAAATWDAHPGADASWDAHPGADAAWDARPGADAA